MGCAVGAGVVVGAAVTAAVAAGTGVGLSIVRRIAELHGGSVSVESNPEETCFSVSLPNGA